MNEGAAIVAALFRLADTAFCIPQSLSQNGTDYVATLSHPMCSISVTNCRICYIPERREVGRVRGESKLYRSRNLRSRWSHGLARNMLLRCYR